MTWETDHRIAMALDPEPAKDPRDPRGSLASLWLVRPGSVGNTFGVPAPFARHPLSAAALIVALFEAGYDVALSPAQGTVTVTPPDSETGHRASFRENWKLALQRAAAGAVERKPK